MKRDLDLIRKMMLAIEADAGLNGRYTKVCYAGQLVGMTDREDDELAYHLMLIIDEGWLHGEYRSTSGAFAVLRLTADGHDFIESTRSPNVWKKARAAMQAGGGETLRFAWDVAKSVAKKEIERRLGQE